MFETRPRPGGFCPSGWVWIENGMTVAEMHHYIHGAPPARQRDRQAAPSFPQKSRSRAPRCFLMQAVLLCLLVSLTTFSVNIKMFGNVCVAA